VTGKTRFHSRLGGSPPDSCHPVLRKTLDLTFGALSGESVCLGTSSVWGIAVI